MTHHTLAVVTLQEGCLVLLERTGLVFLVEGFR